MSKRKNKNSKVNTGLSKSDVEFYKMSLVFAIACVFILLVLRMSSTLAAREATGDNLTLNIYKLCQNPIIISAFAVLGVAAAVWFVYCRVKKVDEKMKVFSSTGALTLVAYLGVFYLNFGRQPRNTNHMFFLTFTIVVCGIFFVSKIYNRDFVFFSTMNAFFALAMYFLAFSGKSALYVIIKIAVIALGFVICVLFEKKNSTRTKSTKKNGRGLFFVPVYISWALWTLGMLWNFIAQVNPVLFLSGKAMLIILLVQYLVAALVYTIRLIKE